MTHSTVYHFDDVKYIKTLPLRLYRETLPVQMAGGGVIVINCGLTEIAFQPTCILEVPAKTPGQRSD